METTDYVSYPIALALKKAGFDWPCISFYRNLDKELWEGGEMNWNNGVDCSAPTLAVAQKWLREKDIAVSVQAREIQGELWYSADIITTKGINELVDGGFDYMDYEAALSAGIASALELIITPSPDLRH